MKYRKEQRRTTRPHEGRRATDRPPIVRWERGRYVLATGRLAPVTWRGTARTVAEAQGWDW